VCRRGVINMAFFPNLSITGYQCSGGKHASILRTNVERQRQEVPLKCW
jgi:hypothetical protein